MNESKLTNSNLEFNETNLRLFDEKGETVFNVLLDEIDSCTIDQRIDAFAILAAGSSCATLYIAFWVSAWMSVTIILTIIASIMFLIGLTTLFERQLHFFCGEHVHTASISAADTEEELQQFLDVLQQRIQRNHTPYAASTRDQFV